MQLYTFSQKQLCVFVAERTSASSRSRKFKAKMRINIYAVKYYFSCQKPRVLESSISRFQESRSFKALLVYPQKGETIRQNHENKYSDSSINRRDRTQPSPIGRNFVDPLKRRSENLFYSSVRPDSYTSTRFVLQRVRNRIGPCRKVNKM